MAVILKQNGWSAMMTISIIGGYLYNKAVKLTFHPAWNGKTDRTHEG